MKLFSDHILPFDCTLFLSQVFIMFAIGFTTSVRANVSFVRFLTSRISSRKHSDSILFLISRYISSKTGRWIRALNSISWTTYAVIVCFYTD